ncbi:MAG TPA: hypothetical protein VLM85_22165 [Polyangiaceae bacterium]|nr:hypothetical protein [Polyangiaceae bacterium]
MMPYPQQGPAAPPPKKGMSGCMIALLVVGSVALLGGIVVGVGIYLFATSDAGKTAIKVIGEGSKLAEKGMNAPGTPELRALGCEQAIVLDMKDVTALMGDLIDAGPDAGMPEGLMVTCQVRGGARAPSCDDVAATYVRAVKSAGSEFVVTVQRQGDSHPLCESTYDASGAFIGSGSGGTTAPRPGRGI